MANLLPRDQPRELFAALSAEQRARFEQRAHFLVGQSWKTVARHTEILSDSDPSGDSGGDLALELEELEAAPSLSACQALVDRVDAVRRGSVRSGAMRCGE